MGARGEVWAIIVGGGEGAPKPFVPIVGGATPFELAVARAQRLVPRKRIVAVVAAEPGARSTAPALLLALRHVLAEDPAARVIVLPSDHSIACEDRMQDAIALALSTVDRAPGDEPIVTIGVSSRSPDPNVAWIVPEDRTRELSGVSLFIEKPQPATAALLFEQNAWWGTMIFVGEASAMLRAYERGGPQRAPDMLRVLKAPDCGWLDLRSAEHLLELRRRFGNVTGRERDIPASEPGALGAPLSERARAMHSIAACSPTRPSWSGSTSLLSTTSRSKQQVPSPDTSPRGAYT